MLPLLAASLYYCLACLEGCQKCLVFLDWRQKCLVPAWKGSKMSCSWIGAKKVLFPPGRAQKMSCLSGWAPKNVLSAWIGAINILSARKKAINVLSSWTGAKSKQWRPFPILRSRGFPGGWPGVAEVRTLRRCEARRE